MQKIAVNTGFPFSSLSENVNIPLFVILDLIQNPKITTHYWILAFARMTKRKVAMILTERSTRDVAGKPLMPAVSPPWLTVNLHIFNDKTVRCGDLTASKKGFPAEPLVAHATLCNTFGKRSPVKAHPVHNVSVGENERGYPLYSA